MAIVAGNGAKTLTALCTCTRGRHCPLKKLPILHHVSAEKWRQFEQLAAVHAHRRGNILFYQGNRPLGLYFICSGRVKLVKEDRLGRSQIVRIVEAPDLLGDRSFFAEKSYACTGEVMEDSQICFLEKNHFEDLFSQDAEMWRSLAKRFARELGCAEDYMFCIAACTVKARLASHLMRCWRPSADAQNKNGEFVLAESRTELAQILGTVPEAISHALAELCSRKLISVQGRQVRVLDGDRLRLAGCLPERDE